MAYIQFKDNIPPELTATIVQIPSSSKQGNIMIKCARGLIEAL